jgi:hypothetical protein
MAMLRPVSGLLLDVLASFSVPSSEGSEFERSSRIFPSSLFAGLLTVRCTEERHAGMAALRCPDSKLCFSFFPSLFIPMITFETAPTKISVLYFFFHARVSPVIL